MAQASQALTTQPGQQPATGTAAGDGPRRDGQGRLGRLISEYLGDRVFRQLALVLGLAVAIAAGVGLVMWVQDPMYRPLFADLPAKDASAVMDALQSANIPFQVDQNSGAIMVPVDRIYDARMTLSAQGLPQTGGVGFESLRKDPGFGTSRFLQTARFHRALETELGRTITSLNAVRSARVHLAIPERSAFIGDNRKPTASVTLTLFPGRSLSDGQVQAVVNLVAGAVPELGAERVTVVDQAGTLLTGQPDGGGVAASGEQLAQERRVERNYVRRIRDLLAPIVGRDKVRAEVDAELDFSVTERTEERYLPDQTALRSEQVSNDRAVRGEGPIGVPGALTNQPPAGGELAPAQPGEQGQQDQQGANAQGQAGNGDAQTQVIDASESATRNYEVSRVISHRTGEVGTIQRLSVAVLLDQPTTTNDAGEAVAAPFSPGQLAEIRSLVQRAVGFNPDRGDTLDVVSTEFRAPAEQAPTPSTPLWEQPWVWELGRLLLATIVGLVLILAVIRPLIQGLLGRDRRRGDAERQGGEAPAQGAQIEGQSPEQAQLMAERAQRQVDSGGASRGSEEYEQRVQAAREMASSEPALAANVIKSWLSPEGSSE